MRLRLAFLIFCLLSVQAVAQTEAQKSAMAEVEKSHPQWRQTVQSPEFSNWLSRQPASLVKMATSSWDPTQVNVVLDLFARDVHSQPAKPVAPPAPPMTDTDRALGLLGVVLGATASYQQGRGFGATNAILSNDRAADAKSPAKVPDYNCQQSVLGNSYSCVPR